MTLYEKIKQFGELEGWAQQDKMRLMADTVVREKPALCVEVGVYGGRSALPVLEALRMNGTDGRLVAIDPYNSRVYADGEQVSAEDWMRTFDFAPIKAGFLKAVTDAGLNSWLDFREDRSLAVVPTLTDGSVGFFHLDGGHASDVALADMRAFWPKIAAGGIVVIDDTNWDTLRPTIDFVEASGASLIHDGGTFRVYRKG